jgi:hypothetical protein
MLHPFYFTKLQLPENETVLKTSIRSVMAMHQSVSKQTCVGTRQGSLHGGLQVDASICTCTEATSEAVVFGLCRWAAADPWWKICIGWSTFDYTISSAAPSIKRPAPAATGLADSMAFVKQHTWQCVSHSLCSTPC